MQTKITTVYATLLAMILWSTINSSVVADQGQTQSIRTNGFDMGYVEKGSGPLLILIHGSFSDHRTWRDHIDLFASQYRVIAPTLRYSGTDDWQPDWPGYSDRLLADDIAGFIQALDAGPAHLVGWSRGAIIAHLTSLLHPQQVRSAYLFEGIVTVEPEKDEDIAPILEAWGKAYSTANAVLKEKGPKAAVPHYIDAVVGQEGAFDSYPAWTQKMFMDNARTIPIIGQAQATTMTCQQFQETTVPTRLAVGTETAPHFKLIWKAYEPCLRSDQFMKIEGAAHNWPRVDAHGFFESVKAFTLEY